MGWIRERISRDKHSSSVNHSITDRDQGRNEYPTVEQSVSFPRKTNMFNVHHSSLLISYCDQMIDSLLQCRMFGINSSIVKFGLANRTSFCRSFPGI